MLGRKCRAEALLLLAWMAMIVALLATCRGAELFVADWRCGWWTRRRTQLRAKVQEIRCPAIYVTASLAPLASQRPGAGAIAFSEHAISGGQLFQDGLKVLPEIPITSYRIGL